MFSKIFKFLGGCKEKEYLTRLEEAQIVVNDLNQKIDELRNQRNIQEPKVMGAIKFEEAYKTLSKLTGATFLSDEIFHLTDINEAKSFSAATKVFARKWVKEDHDCDNFSFALMGYWSDGLKSFAFGIAWSEGHAFNIMIDNKKQIWIVEPQTNEYMTVEEAKKRSSPDGLSYFPIRLILL